jgi:hypothetical protein
MDAAKEDLLSRLRREYDTFAEKSRMVHNLNYLEDISPGFIGIATDLIDTCHPDAREATVSVLRSWACDDPNVPSAYKNAVDLNMKYGTSYNEAHYILEDVIRTKSTAEVFASSDKIPNFRTRGQKLVADILIIKNYPEIRPDLLDASKDEIERYFHPLVVAASIVIPRENEDRFVREVRTFITWAASQEDMPKALASALFTNSIDPDTIRAIMGMRTETSVPLYDGLL